VQNDSSSFVKNADRDSIAHGLSKSVDIDALTGLATRQHLVDFLESLSDRAKRECTKYSLILVDLDRFKKANDSFGPIVCDVVLARAAQRLRSIACAAALVARISGDGFAVVLMEPNDAPVLAAKLLKILSRSFAVSGHIVNVGASIGICKAGSNGTFGLFQAANTALHDAQRAGGNQVCCFDPSMQERVSSCEALEADFRAAIALQQGEFRRAINGQQFEVHYQPQIALADGRLTGFEALARWHHPERGFVPSDTFIPMAEELGLIGILGDWVLQTACRDAMLWPSTKQTPDLVVAVNVSPLQLRDGRALLYSIQKALIESGLPASRLEIELTETALANEITSTLAAIRRMGVALSLDDFGTGYSSLSRLAQLPFNRMKIDRSFVSGLGKPVHEPGAKSGEKILSAIASLGEAFGLATVVEGVETIEQMDIVRKAGCTEMQGYLISRPVSASNVIGLIQQIKQRNALKEKRSETGPVHTSLY
jgi:diguanylate cyclase (GGDEF)-like protein